MKVVTRAYNEWKYDWYRGTATKFSSTDRLKHEINYYRRIPERYKIMFPRVIESCVDSGANPTHWLTLENYRYLDLGQYLLGYTDTPLTYEDWHEIMVHLLAVINDWSQHSVGEPENYEDALAMYVTKTVEEQYKFETLIHMKSLFEDDQIFINNCLFKTFNTIWPEIKQYVCDVIIPGYKVGMIHGDLCFSNILYGDNTVLRFIDPRGKFGNEGIMGDPRYDVAKLYHSVDGGYEFFNNNEFFLKIPKTDNDSWVWGYGENHHEFSWHDKLNALSTFNEVFFDSFDKKEITIIEGLIYIGACARHYENPDRQIALYLCGLQLLNKGIKL